jgi:hypothetical protein
VCKYIWKGGGEYNFPSTDKELISRGTVTDGVVAVSDDVK